MEGLVHFQHTSYLNSGAVRFFKNKVFDSPLSKDLGILSSSLKYDVLTFVTTSNECYPERNSNFRVSLLTIFDAISIIEIAFRRYFYDRNSVEYITIIFHLHYF